MALYLTTQKVDRETGESPTVVINAEDAKNEGINKGDIVSMTWKQDVVLYVVAEITDTEIPQGVLGVYEDVWTRYKIPTGDIAAISRIGEYDYELRIIKKGTDDFTNLEEHAINFIGYQGKKFGYLSNSEFLKTIK